jgi:hypothetical protein
MRQSPEKPSSQNQEHASQVGAIAEQCWKPARLRLAHLWIFSAFFHSQKIEIAEVVTTSSGRLGV